MRTFGFEPNKARVKWRGKTMCYLPECRYLVGEEVTLVMLPSGDLKAVTAEELAAAPNPAKVLLSDVVNAIRYRGEAWVSHAQG